MSENTKAPQVPQVLRTPAEALEAAAKIAACAHIPLDEQTLSSDPCATAAEAATRIRALISQVEEKAKIATASTNSDMTQKMIIWCKMNADDMLSVSEFIKQQATHIATLSAELARVREVMGKLENANNLLAAKRSEATYLSIIDVDKASDELVALDAARQCVRDFLSQSPDSRAKEDALLPASAAGGSPALDYQTLVKLEVMAACIGNDLVSKLCWNGREFRNVYSKVPDPRDARIAELEDALKPFAEEALTWGEKVPDDHYPVVVEMGHTNAAYYGSAAKYNVGHLRHAHKIYHKRAGEKG